MTPAAAVLRSLARRGAQTRVSLAAATGLGSADMGRLLRFLRSQGCVSATGGRWVLTAAGVAALRAVER